MRFISVAILAIALNSFSQVEPCQDYTCDSLAVRAILDSNGLDEFDNIMERPCFGPPTLCVKVNNGRISTLRISDIDLKTLPPEIGQLTALQHLFLEGNQLTSLPPEIWQLTALIGLRLDDNQLTSLPPEIGQLTALEFFLLDNNQLTSLPPEIGQLTALTGLFLSGNLLTSLPPEITKLSMGWPPDPVTGLGIQNNMLCSLPDSIEAWIDEHAVPWEENWRETQKVDSLHYCDGSIDSVMNDYLAVRAILDSNGLHAFSVVAVTDTDATGRVVNFRLNDCQLTNLPPEIGQLTALETLQLSHNQLTSIPPEIGQLTALELLHLEYNQLTSLPAEIGQLTALTGLYLDGNQLTIFPPEIFQLSALSSLHLSNNQLTSLPSEIIQIPMLDWILVDSNYLCSLPDSIEAWLDTSSAALLWRETQDCGPCQDTNYLEYGTNEPCFTLNVYGYSTLENMDFKCIPFNHSLTITFPNFSDTKEVFIYTLKGALVKKFETSQNSITWNAKESGVYYIRAVVDGRAVFRKVVL
jgi:Leucine-rich repeat (LRR) protein